MNRISPSTRLCRLSIASVSLVGVLSTPSSVRAQVGDDRIAAQQGADAAPTTTIAPSTSANSARPVGSINGSQRPPSKLGAPITIHVTDSVVLRIAPPEGWIGADVDDVHIEALEQVPGARALFKRVWMSNPPGDRAPMSRLSVTCVVAPSDDWVPGVESTVLERAIDVAKGDLSEWMSVDAVTPGPLLHDAPLFTQAFDTQGKVGGLRKKGSVRVLEPDNIEESRIAIAGTGRNLLGFLAGPNRVLVCSASCLERSEKPQKICPSVIASTQLEGPMAPEPSASIAATIVQGFRNQPALMVAMTAGFAIALAGMLAILRGLLLRTALQR